MNKKISYYNMRLEAEDRKLPALIGRTEEMDRLDRVIQRRTGNNAIIIGASGVGKTALVWGWMKRLAQNPALKEYALVQLDAEHLHNTDGTTTDALASLPK